MPVSLTFYGLAVLCLIAPLFRSNSGKLSASVVGLLLICLGFVNGPVPVLPYKLVLVLVGMGGALLLSTLRAGYRVWPEVVLPSLQRCDGLLTWVCYLAIACAASLVTHLEYTYLVSALLIVGTFVSLVGIAQHRGAMTLFLPGGVKDGAVFQGRAWGTLGNPLFFGGYLCLVLPLGVMWAISAGHYWAVVPSAIMAVALITSGARSAWFGVAVALPAIAAKALIALIALPAIPFRNRISDTLKDGVFSSGSGRIYIWKATLQKAWDRIELGHGLNRLALPNPDPKASDFYDSPHNELLYVLFHLGIVGLVAYLAVWGLTFSVAPWIFIPSLIAYFVWLQFAWSHVGPANVFWLLVGLAWVR